MDKILVSKDVPDGEYPFVMCCKLVVRDGLVVKIEIDDNIVSKHYLYSSTPGGHYSLCTLAVKDEGKYPHWPEPEPI